MLKTRTKIIHHNAKLSKKNDLTEDYRDQGLVRPKVCIQYNKEKLCTPFMKSVPQN